MHSLLLMCARTLGTILLCTSRLLKNNRLLVPHPSMCSPPPGATLAAPQLGGELRALEQHVQQVEGHAVFADRAIDFKLTASAGPASPEAARETGFQTLSVALCKVCAHTRPALLATLHQAIRVSAAALPTPHS